MPELSRPQPRNYVYYLHTIIKREAAVTQEAANRKISSSFANFFALYPGFAYDATKPALREFYRLCKQSGWAINRSERIMARERFMDAMIDSFAISNNADARDVVAWADWCAEMGRWYEPYPILRNLLGCVLDMVDVVRSFQSDREIVAELTDILAEEQKTFPQGSAIMGKNKSVHARAMWNFVLGELLERPFPKLGIYSRNTRAG